MKTIHNEAKKQMDLYTDDGAHVGRLEYMKGGGDLYATSTEVFPGNEGKGYGTQLVDALAQYARLGGAKIQPICPFVKATFAKHQDTYGDVWKH